MDAAEGGPSTPPGSRTDWSWQDVLDPAPAAGRQVTWVRYARALALAFLVYMAVGIAISTVSGSNLGGLAGLVVGTWAGCRLQGLHGVRTYLAVAVGLLAIEVLVAVLLMVGAGGGWP
jgi:hypothetical protein